MKTNTQSPNGLLDQYLVLVGSGPDGQFTAQVVGLPEIQATAGSRADALSEVRRLLQQWLDSGQLVLVELPHEPAVLRWFGHADPQDPLEQEYLAELAKARQEDLERTLRDSDQKSPIPLRHRPPDPL